MQMNFSVASPDSLLSCLARAREGDRVLIPPAVYGFHPRRAHRFSCSLSNSDPAPELCAGILLKGKKDLILDGQGSVLLCHGQISPIALLGCRNLTLQNFILDWDIPLTAEGRITASGEDHTDVQVDPGKFPFHIQEQTLYFDGGDWSQKLNFWGHTEFDPVRDCLAPDRGDRFPPSTQQLLPDGQIRFTGDFRGKEPTPGNILVLRHGHRIHPGILIHDCRKITLQNIRIHGSGGLGILAQFSKDLTFSHVDLVPNREKGRFYAGVHDDGIHLSGNSGEICIENCSFSGLMDDPINIHGIAVKLKKQLTDDTVLGSFMHPQSRGHLLWARPGDLTALLDGNTMEELCRLTVQNYRLLNDTDFEITFGEPLTGLPFQSCSSFSLENLSSCPHVICRGNFFGPCRARGLLVTTPGKVLIADNVFRSSGAAIRIAGDVCTWYESGRCRDVTIEHNLFTETCLSNAYQGGQAVISISPELPGPDPRFPCHQNIRIRENIFRSSTPHILYALCTEDLLFCHNRIFLPCGEPVYTLEHCKNPCIQDNQIQELI